jgi:hypothetical protein
MLDELFLGIPTFTYDFSTLRSSLTPAPAAVYGRAGCLSNASSMDVQGVYVFKPSYDFVNAGPSVI